MIKPSRIINSIENDSQVLAYRLSGGELIWPLARHDVITSILNQNNQLDLPTTKSAVNKLQLLRTMLVSIWTTPYLIRKRKVIFFSTGVTNVRNESGKYFNRVTDPFYFHFPKGDAVLVESTAFGVMRLPRVHKSVYANLTLLLIARIKRIFGKISDTDSRSIAQLVNHLESKLNEAGIEFNKGKIGDIISRNVRNYYSAKNLYRNFLAAKKPRAIFVEDACYGNSSPLVLAARATGIPVIELQHGFVNDEHIAYNLGPGIIGESEVARYFPDYFFSYGQFWNDSIRIPSRKVSVGNPYLTQSVSVSEEKASGNENLKVILYLSSGVTVKETNTFLASLFPAATKNGYTLLFRPHPLESNVVADRYGSILELGVTLSTNAILYADIASAQIIIGEASTSLFEALAFKNKRCFLFWSSYTQSYLSNSMNLNTVDAGSVETIFSSKDENNKVSGSYFWEPEWEKKFQKAMSDLGIR